MATASSYPGYTTESIGKIRDQKKKTHLQKVKDQRKKQADAQNQVEEMQKQLNQRDMELQVIQ